MQSSQLLAAILYGLLNACTSHAKFVVHETATDYAAAGWRSSGRANSSTQLNLSIALKQPGLQELRIRLDDISNPSHEDYGAHISRSSIRRYGAASEAAVDAVVNWLGENGITDILVPTQRAWIHFNASVSQVDALLDCSISKLEGVQGVVYRSQEYSLPEDLLQFVDYVFPVTQFMAETGSKTMAKHNTRRSSLVDEAVRSGPMARADAGMPASCTTVNNINPDCIVDLYNITYLPPSNLGNGSTALAVAGFLEEYPGLNYVHDFLSAFSPQRNHPDFTTNYNFSMISVNGGELNDQGTGGEANLDMMYTMSFVQPLDVVYYSVGGRGPYINDDGANATGASINEPWVPFLEYLLEQEAVPEVISISYTDDEQTIPRPYANRVCDLFMQLTSRGVSVLVASGDGGQAGTGTSQMGCYANDGFQNKTQFIPTFPADCPYVTSVGATASYSRTAGADLSAGGFSNYFARPSWQDNAIGEYIAALNGSHAGWYNASGRGIPDIAAVGSRIAISGGGLHTKGTSASTPIVASMIALINDKRKRAGQPVLGFLNPLLYSGKIESALTDCTEGSGGSCSYGNNVELGFDSLPGWDAVTGLGTLNFGLMAELLS